MTTPFATSTTDSQMHNNIMAAGLRDRPYIPTTVVVPVVPVTDDSPAVLEHTTIEIPMNMSPKNKAHYESEKEAIHLILTRTRDEIYSTVDACKTAQEMFVTIVKQQHKLDEVFYHKLFDIQKQYQKEVNELRAERIARNANPLALVATAQPTQDPYYQTPKPHKPYAPTSNALIPTRSHATTRNKGKEIAKPITPPSESASEEDKSQKGLKTSRITRKRCCCANKLSKVQYDDEYNVFANVNRHYEQSESTSNTCLVEKDDSDDTLDSPDMCEHDIHTDQNAEDERDALANLIANLKLDVDENKKIQKKLKKANTSLAHELEHCKSILVETSKTLEESNSETLGLLAQKDIDIKKGLKLKAYEILVVKEKHDELVKQILLTKSHYEGLVKEKIKVITDLKQKEDRDIDKMISMEKQLQFLNKIVYKRNQTIQTIHMLAPKGPTFNGRPTFANPMYLKKAQSKKPCLYEIPNEHFDPTNRLVPNKEETLTLAKETPQGNHEQLAHANEIRKKTWRKSFVKVKPNIFKNIDFLPVSKSISKSRQAYNVMTNNINHFKEIVNQAWVKHSMDHISLRPPTAHDIQILIKACLMPLALMTQNDSLAFVHELKQEMHADLKYVESPEKEIDDLESDKA
uniref:Integrase, catalytic region, zinc finger, CCHC-type, peptidase aspartic, catalytic n=1 Tax=Tanacetum cinerariifolium TaxID=118510 RepID=A0A6L2P992_TANCI|nr:hypothetical protein [Tanacetum cinerariifolium]